jgi:DNA-binding NtrC family response regulator
LSAARRTSHPIRALSARLLQAEADRRRSRAMSDALARTLRRLSSAAPPVLKARWDLLSALRSTADADSAVSRQITHSGLKALGLFSSVVHEGSSLFDPVVRDVVSILEVCQHAEDEAGLLRDVCKRVRQRLRAAGVALFGAHGRELTSLADDGISIRPDVAQRALGITATIAPACVAERIEGAALIEYGGRTIGVLCARWTIGTTDDLSRAGAVLAMAAVAAAPLVAAHEAHASTPTARPAIELLGITPRMEALRRDIERAAAAPYPILIEGESGSGKELVARAVHRTGPRRDRPFAALNCAALPDDLVESELFGHARGAFTSAVADRPGVFEEAHGGLLFLDEVGELSLRAQAKLLRVIQEGELRRIGENLPRRVDVRIVAATNRDLRREVEASRFRLDLLYRLDVVRIAVPALRDHTDDIAVLVDHFWSDATRRLGSRATLSASACAALASYSWPGNVRELQNVLAALAVRSPKRGVVPTSALPAHIAGVVNVEGFRLLPARRAFEEAFVRAALVRTGGHRGQAAEALGVSRQGLTKLIARLDIE